MFLAAKAKVCVNELVMAQHLAQGHVKSILTLRSLNGQQIYHQIYIHFNLSMLNNFVSWNHDLHLQDKSVSLVIELPQLDRFLWFHGLPRLERFVS